MTSLRVSPDRECLTGAGTRNLLRGPYRIQNSPSFADADQIRMHFRRPETRIVCGGHYVATREHLVEPLYRGEEHARKRWRTAADDAGRRMGPSNDRSPAGRF